MPDFFVNGKLYYNPVEFTLDHIGGTWKIPILWRLKDKSHRYSELKKSIPHISDKMLTSQLKELEANGFIAKEIFAEVPIRTQYSMTDKGRKAVPIMVTMRNFGIELMALEGIDTSNY